ncbi:cytochrome P450 [Streptomyces sp. NPDC051976]|uniref:cytochrome P450 n=1 Tax=Streptomyces sp. NPDC051976 TaxID=3154947 RepID=UPI00342AF32D
MATTKITSQLLRWLVLREGWAEDSTDLFARLVREAPVVRFPGANGMWVVSRHDLVTKISNHKGFATVRPTFPEHSRENNADFVDFFTQSLTFQPPDDHRRLRGVLAGGFTSLSLERLRERTAALIDELLAPLVADGGGEFVSQVAVPLPSLVTAALLDLPEEDWPSVTGWARGMLAQLGAAYFGAATPMDPISIEQFRALRSYVDEVVRRREKSRGPDVISRLAAAKDARQVSHEEVVNLVLLLFMTGVDTVTSALANSLVGLLGRPQEWRRVVADPDRAGAAFEESVRLLAPAAIGVRTAREDVAFGARTVREGDVVMLAYAAANLDPRRFEDPLEFRWDRVQSTSMTFGHGRHYCLGARLGLMQGELVLRKLAGTDVALARTEPLVWRNELAFNSPAELRLRFGPDTAVPRRELSRGMS